MDTPSAPSTGMEGAARWSLRLFGEFELRKLPGREKVTVPGKRERVLLAYLALSPNCRQLRRKLTLLLWGDASDETALDNLRTCIFNLRRALDDTEHRLISSDSRDIVLDAAAFEVDVLAFRDLAAQSDRMQLETAAELYTGEFLDGLSIHSEEFESWHREQTTRCRDRALDVLTRLMAQLAKSGETERAIEGGLRILRLEPLHEAAARQLMQLYGESGRRGAAMQVYRTLADALRTEFNSQPEAETAAIFAEIVGGGEQIRAAAAENTLLDHKTTVAPSTVSPRESEDATAEDAKLPPIEARAPPPSDPLGKPLLAASFRLRTALAVLAGVLMVTAALISYWQFALFGTQAVVAERNTSAAQASIVSIAVLPFANLSGDANQEFFSDGMTEEITAALAKIADLRVVGRTSAFQFKGQNQDMRAVGQALGATHLIEGSVRKAGDRVRVTAQLVRTADGIGLWADNYDRELKDIFATQEDIAQAIAGALRVPLGLQQGERLVSSRTGDLDSYEQYLRAKAMYRGRNLDEAIKILEPLVARDPGFAPAWGQLARAYILLPNYSPVLRTAPVEEARRFVQSYSDKAEMAAQEAVRLDSRYAGGYFALADIRSLRGKWAEAEDLFRRALDLDTNDPDVLSRYVIMLNSVGRLKESLRVSEQLQMIEPFVPLYNVNLAAQLQANGQNAASIPVLKEIPQDAGINFIRNTGLARAYAAEGRFAEASDTLLQIKGKQVSQRSVADAARSIRTAPAKAEAPEALPVLEGELNLVYAYVGALDRVLEYPERGIAINFLGATTMGLPWHPPYAPLRKTERFKTLVRNAGLVDYWRARGWPDLCRPVGANDFVCD